MFFFSFKKKITPFIVSFDAQNDKWQISSTLSTPTTQPQTQSQTQAHTSTSLHRQHDTFPSVTSAHMSQQANFDSMMSYSGTGGCHSTPLAVPAAAFPGAAPEKPAARNSVNIYKKKTKDTGYSSQTQNQYMHCIKKNHK